MALSIVPVLLSLLPSPSAGDLLVHVVDKDGKPVGGVQVCFVNQHGGMGPLGWMDFPMETVTTGAADGTALLTQLAGNPAPDEHRRYFVRLGIPAIEDIQAPLDPTQPPAAGITLVAPDTGVVLLKTPVRGKGRALLRRAPLADDEHPPFWYGSEPPSVQLVDGFARFERVGLGVELEYRVNSPDLPTELAGKFKGPTTKGQTVEFTVKGLEGSPTLLAKLVGGDTEPIGNLLFDWSIGMTSSTSSGSSASSSGGHVRSDEKGRVRIPLVGAHAQAGERQLSLNAWSDADSAKRLGRAYTALAIPPEFTSGECDLGEVIVVPYGSPARFLRVDDEALKRAFEAPREGMSIRPSNDAGNPLEELLSEMVRRGGPAWEAYVAGKLAALRADSDPFGGSDVGELELLTALRRLQHKPDPLALVIKTESTLDVRFPETPVVEFEWKNVDSGGEPFGLARGGSYRSGRFARCNVQATGPRELGRLPPRELGSGMAGGMYSTEKLAAGETEHGGLPLGNFVAFDAPGEYRVRIHYHDKEDIDSLEDLNGRFVSSSEEFLVHIQPLEVPLTQVRLDETRSWVHQIDKQKQIPLVSGHWHAGIAFNGTATDPEDKLFRAGLEAVPALFDALEEQSLEPERRAWVFGMLWNILGIENPESGLRCGALGNRAWIKKWPTSTEEAPLNFGEFGTSATTPIAPEAQSRLENAWRKWRSLIVVKIVP